eukprot:2362638-Rhodomonas_salina.2
MHWAEDYLELSEITCVTWEADLACGSRIPYVSTGHRVADARNGGLSCGVDHPPPGGSIRDLSTANRKAKISGLCIANAQHEGRDATMACP